MEIQDLETASGSLSRSESRVSVLKASFLPLCAYGRLDLDESLTLDILVVKEHKICDGMKR